MDTTVDLDDPYLRNYFADTRSTSAAARALFDELSPGQLLFKPAPKVWSVAECFAHLTTTAELYHPRVVHALEAVRGEGEGAAPPFKARWLRRRFIAMVGPQSKRKIKTFKLFEPAAAELDPAAVERGFFARQDELADLLRKADGCDLNRGRVDSPITRWLHFNLGEVFWLLTAHAQRHLLQAERLRRSAGFPVE